MVRAGMVLGALDTVFPIGEVWTGMDREQLLRDEYDRLLLEEVDDSEQRLQGPSEPEIRERFRQFYLSRTGHLPSPDEENDAIGFVVRTTTFSHQPLLEEIATKIESSIPAVARQEERLDTFIDDSVLVRVYEYPAGTFNAQTRPVADAEGYLVLIDTAAIALLQQVTKLMGYAVRPTPDGFTYTNEAFLGTPPRTPAEELAEVVAFYLGLPVSDRAGALPRLSGPAATRMDDLFQSTVTFIVAHEYAHALAGHFSQEMTKVEGLIQSFDRRGWHTGESTLEIAADWLGAKLLISQWNDVDDTAAQTGLQTLLAGPLFFFALQAVIAEAERGMQRDSKLGEVIGIAPPVVRQAMMHQLYDAAFGDTRYPLTELYEGWLPSISEDVILAIPPAAE